MTGKADKTTYETPDKPEVPYEIDLTKVLDEIALTRAQIKLTSRQAQTEFWKIGVACVIAGAAVGGILVQLLHT